ncbi:MAG: acyl-CoA carboxylase subunit beta [Anaerolineae bacterium]
MSDNPHQLLLERIEQAHQGGAEKYHKQLVEQNKMFVRDRIDYLLDPGTFVEDGLLTRVQEGLAADAVVTGIGKIGGRLVAIIANDYTVKAGTWGRKTYQKMTYTQEKADELGIPLLYLVDSAGARLDEQHYCYAGHDAMGNIFYNQIRLSGRIPQICILFGPSPAGSAYVPALCDVCIMVDKNANAYLGSPRMAEMVIGEKVTLEQMGGARMHCVQSGLGDVLAKNDKEALDLLLKYLSYFPQNWREQPKMAEGRAPVAGREIEDIVPLSQSVPFDMYELIQRVIDEGSFFEIKRLFAPELITGLARLNGRPIGIVANQSKVKGGVLFPDSSDKAARFVWACNAFNIPLLFLCDISGYMIGSQVERQGIIRHGAKMLFAVCESTVPRICVMVRKAYGGGYLAMSGNPTQPDCTIALPTARPAVMGPEAAINAVYYNKIMELPEEERAAYIAEKRAEYEENIDPYAVASEFFIEAVIPGRQLRDELILRYDAYSVRPPRRVERRNGVMPV